MVSHQARNSSTEKWQVIAGWFLTLSYVIGAPVYAIIEANSGLFSERFDYSPGFLYLVSIVQFACALVLFVRSLAPWASAILTALALGAVYSHVSIGSPLTSLPAIAYVFIQIWYGIRIYRQNQEKST
ncbi:DoxX family protein [Elongatibacter sediminis]|uniref:DoxX family protein n=1 Tax=Elongatibacter sediminis TaxID=3119006 RepID=UPI00339D96D7